LLDRAGKPDEPALREYLYNQIKLLAIELGIIGEFFKTYRNIVDKVRNN
ncbi:MAG: hypothetical protein HC836_50125, partial [Richelia sp. RM2_1_2]|nr:hypothetical protein [Richelia sp. RM2_1_2]